MEKLYEKGLENYPKLTVFLTNALLLLWFGLAVYGMSKIEFAGLPIVSILYLIFMLIMLGFVLRKHLCTHCYYYDSWCGTGWGKLSAYLFIQKSPLAMFLHKEFLVSGGVSLACFIIIMIINQFGRKKGCSQCKMRCICKASAYKGCPEKQI
jgi:hypothetical protein